MRQSWTGVPQELRDAATPLVTRYGFVLPDWVQLLSVRYDDELTESYATVVSEQRYKRVTITFGTGWLSIDAEEREWVIAHELSHTVLAPIERMWDELLEEIPKRLRNSAEKRFDNALEEAVSGLAYALVRESK